MPTVKQTYDQDVDLGTCIFNPTTNMEYDREIPI